MTMLRPIRFALFLGLGFVLGACSGDDDVKLDDVPAADIYALGESQLADRKPEEAAKTFDEVDRLYPFSQLAKRAIVMSAFSYYEAQNYSSARASARRYLDLYPSGEDAAYAQHLIALTWYDNIVDIGRDQGVTENALKALNEVVNRYPESDYARDAQLKLDLTLNHLAGKEMAIGRYYLKRGHYIAAINRFRKVVEEYQTTSQTPEALHRMVEANLSLGLEREALASAAVLGHNYPGSPWYANSYELLTGRNLLPEDQQESDSFLKRVYRRVIKGDWL